MTPSAAAVLGICTAATAGIVVRPFRWPEAVWAGAGVLAVTATGLLTVPAALMGIAKGVDVYLFLIGMMLLSETARRQGLFDRTADWAVAHAGGSPTRLFLLVYAAGVVITAFLSNDATAVVLTPAVYAAARRARVDPLPLLFACAMVANAASFVLPISNPANIVLYGGHMPAPAAWFASFALPSLAAIVVTWAALRWAERARLRGRCHDVVEATALTGGGKAALAAIGATALLLLAVAALDRPLGLPTFVAGAATTLGIAAATRTSPLPVIRGVSWSVVPLVAGLFVLVEALDQAGIVHAIAEGLRHLSATPVLGAGVAGTTLALVSNLVNNLPAGLVASSAVAQAQPPRIVVDALLIGVDLGPNLSVTGSLATILWLQAVRREGGDVGFGRFLAVGAVTMPPALAAALAMRLALG